MERIKQLHRKTSLIAAICLLILTAWALLMPQHLVKAQETIPGRVFVNGKQITDYGGSVVCGTGSATLIKEGSKPMLVLDNATIDTAAIVDVGVDAQGNTIYDAVGIYVEMAEITEAVDLRLIGTNTVSIGTCDQEISTYYGLFTGRIKDFSVVGDEGASLAVKTAQDAGIWIAGNDKGSADELTEVEASGALPRYESSPVYRSNLIVAAGLTVTSEVSPPGAGEVIDDRFAVTANSITLQDNAELHGEVTGSWGWAINASGGDIVVSQGAKLTGIAEIYGDFQADNPAGAISLTKSRTVEGTGQLLVDGGEVVAKVPRTKGKGIAGIEANYIEIQKGSKVEIDICGVDNESALLVEGIANSEGVKIADSTLKMNVFQGNYSDTNFSRVEAIHAMDMLIENSQVEIKAKSTQAVGIYIPYSIGTKYEPSEMGTLTIKDSDLAIEASENAIFAPTNYTREKYECYSRINIDLSRGTDHKISLQATDEEGAALGVDYDSFNENNPELRKWAEGEFPTDWLSLGGSATVANLPYWAFGSFSSGVDSASGRIVNYTGTIVDADKKVAREVIVDASALAITSAAQASVVGGTTSSFQVETDGAGDFSLEKAPDGVTIDAKSGLMTIADTAALGEYKFNIKVANPYSTASQDFTLTITPGEVPSFTSRMAHTVVSTKGGSYQLEAVSTLPVTYSLNEDAPVGVTVDSATGLLNIPAGRPLGRHDFQVTASTSAGDKAEDFVLWSVELAADSIDASKEATFRFENIQLEDIKAIAVDNQAIDLDVSQKNVIYGKLGGKQALRATPGSAYVTLYKNYLGTLAAGHHKLQLTLQDGTTMTQEYDLVQKKIVNTGDDENLMLWSTLALLSLGTIFVITTKRRKNYH